jgi:hypothetical protein
MENLLLLPCRYTYLVFHTQDRPLAVGQLPEVGEYIFNLCLNVRENLGRVYLTKMRGRTNLSSHRAKSARTKIKRAQDLLYRYPNESKTRLKSTWMGDIVALRVCSKSLTLNNRFNGSTEWWIWDVFTSHALFLLLHMHQRTQNKDHIYNNGRYVVLWVCRKSAVFWTTGLTAVQNGGERRYLRHFLALYKWLAVPQAHSRIIDRQSIIIHHLCHYHHHCQCSQCSCISSIIMQKWVSSVLSVANETGQVSEPVSTEYHQYENILWTQIQVSTHWLS